MDIGTVIAGLNALGSLFNEPIPMTPAQMEEKPKKAQQPMNTFVILPNQTPPMGVGVPPAPPPLASPAPLSLVPPAPPLLVPPYDWNQLSPANMLRNPIGRLPQASFGVPMYRGVPLITDLPNFGGISLRDLYELYFGTRR